MKHKVTIKMETGDKVKAEPQKIKMDIGDVLEWSSDDGDPTLLFDPDQSPFATATVHGGSQYMAVRSGRFSYRCALKTKSGKEIGWGDGGGAEVVVETRGG